MCFFPTILCLLIAPRKAVFLLSSTPFFFICFTLAFAWEILLILPYPLYYLMWHAKHYFTCPVRFLFSSTVLCLPLAPRKAVFLLSSTPFFSFSALRQLSPTKLIVLSYILHYLMWHTKYFLLLVRALLSFHHAVFYLPCANLFSFGYVWHYVLALRYAKFFALRY